MTKEKGGGFMITKYNLPNSKNSSGTTSLIRNKLNFDDGIKWNEFCKIRTCLIKSYFKSIDLVHINLTLSENKIKVKQIADCLRIEFNFSVDTGHYFEKLVILAIQSMRRNLIRSQNNSSNRLNKLDKLDKLNKCKEFSPLSNGKDSILSNTNLLSLVINDIINDVVPLKDQKSHQIDSNMIHGGLPDLSIFINEDPLSRKTNKNSQNLLGDKNSKDFPFIPFFLKGKILRNIQKSRTCYQLSRIDSDRINIIEQHRNLIRLGRDSLTLSSRYVFERFYSNSDLNLVDFVFEQINKPKFLSQLSFQLFQSAITIKLSLHDQEMLLSLLNITLGSLIKDFGFDPILYDISEILYHLVLIKYPRLYKNNNSHGIEEHDYDNTVLSGRSSKANTPDIDSDVESHLSKNKDIIVSSLSINPQIANKEVYKKVQIKYQTKVQDFNFPLLSNATPTIKEIVNNCKQLFQIKKDLELNIYYDSTLIKSDVKLANLFNDLNIKVLYLELR